MKIISKQKDYYDHIAHQYGGGDPKIVYVRDKFSKSAFYEECPIKDPNCYLDSCKNILLAYLVVAGRGYVIKYEGPQSWSSPTLSMSFYEPHKINHYKIMPLDWVIPEKEQSRYHYIHKRNPSELLGFTPGEQSEFFIDLSRKVKAPVFAITKVDRGDVILAEHCPNLGEMGFASLFSPAQIYQELSYFVGNVLRESPDVKPPVEISNRDRIVAAGFDLKQSFRHRIKCG